MSAFPELFKGLLDRPGKCKNGDTVWILCSVSISAGIVLVYRIHVAPFVPKNYFTFGITLQRGGYFIWNMPIPFLLVFWFINTQVQYIDGVQVHSGYDWQTYNFTHYDGTLHRTTMKSSAFNHTWRVRHLEKFRCRLLLLMWPTFSSIFKFILW